MAVENYRGDFHILTFRPEIPDNNNSTRYINEQAFGSKEEAEIIEKLRNRAALTLSLVAVQDGEIVEHIAFCPVMIESASSDFEVITLAPMSVLTAYQRQGIGSLLVRVGLQECRRISHEIIVVLGHPTYYPRFGFTPAM